MSICTPASMNRRAFVAGAAGAAALAATSVAHADEATSGEAWDEEFDVIVVGGGIAGLTTAITVAREGDGASCLLVEKCEQGNGCSPVCDGDAMYDIEWDYLKSLNTLPSGELAVPEDVLKVFYEGIKDNLPWLKEIGAPEDKLVINDPGTAFVEYKEFDAEPWYSAMWLDSKNDAPYNHLWRFMDNLRQTEYADAIDYRANTPLEELVQASDGTIEGIVAGGRRYKANKGVVMCIGGFEHNPDMLQSFLGQGQAISWAGTGNTGDGLSIVARVGADFWGMHDGACFWMAQRDLENTTFSNGTYACHKYKKFGITVGQNGRRFYMDWDGHKSVDEINLEWTRDLSLHVGSRHGTMQFGGEWTHLPMPSKAWFIFDQAALDLEEGAFPTDKWGDPVEAGFAYKADTLEELAELCGMPEPSELVKTVDAWNGFCDAGEDMAFYRPSDTLTKIETGPFYAQLCAPTMLNTDGGPKRSARSEVLSTTGEPIPHLYAAGEFGSVWGYLYQGCGNVAECLVFGRIAARNVLGIA